MDVSNLIGVGFSAAQLEDAGSSPSEEIAPEPQVDHADAPASPDLETADDTPNIDELIRQRDELNQWKLDTESQIAEQKRQQQQQEEQHKAELAQRMYQQENQNFDARIKDLRAEGMDELAEKLIEHRSWQANQLVQVSQERDISMKALDAVALVIEHKDPALWQQVQEQAKALLPYQTAEEMENALTQQSNGNQQQAQRIAELESQIAQMQEQLGAAKVDPNAFSVERGGTTLPVGTENRDPAKAKSWAEWSAITGIPMPTGA